MRRLTVLIATVWFVGCGIGFSALADARGFHHRGYHHGGSRIGVFVGLPLYAPVYYPPPYYYYPYPRAVYAEPSTPPVYVERSDIPADAQDSGSAAPDPYWYFCRDAGAYYPYVSDCPAGWERVLPHPPSAGR
jgi:hypothetical protein